jgi:hypothetical protein
VRKVVAGFGARGSLLTDRVEFDRVESACGSPHTSPAVLSGLLRPAQHMPGESLRCAPLPFDIMA